MTNPPRRHRLLLVDDQPANLLALEAVLAPLGCELVQARSAEEALRQAQQGEFALVLLDAQLPGLDGYETARRLRARERTRALPILFLNALAPPEGGLEPFAAEAVRERVAAVLELAGRGPARPPSPPPARELRTREERYRFLAEASVELASTLDMHEALRRVVRLAVPRFADYAAADLLTPEGSRVRVALAHAEPAREARAWQLDREHPAQPDDPVGLAAVLRSGCTGLWPEVPPAAPDGPSHSQQAVVRELGLCSVLLVPLASGGGPTLGALSFAMAESGRRFGEEERSLAEDLARRAAVAVANARAYGEAREANRLKDEFLSLLSHELRTPLTAILGWAQLLRSRALTEEQRAKALEVIERNAHAQRQLVDDLLDVARIASRKLELHLGHTDLRQVVETAVDSVQVQADAKGVRLLVALGRVPPLLADGERLVQVVWNLLVNAVKFTPSGGRVQVSLEARGEEARLEVRDSGEGIDPEFLPLVFERFRQGDRASVRSHRGLGLGLSIVKHLVEAHRGRVEARSDGAGRGASFVVWLPVGEAEAPPPRPKERAEASLAGLRVLVVEDEADVRDMVRATLERRGAQVTTAASAEEAYTWFGLERPAVLVCDVGLPLEDGYGLIRRLREAGERVPALALTAFAGEADRARALEAGFDLYLAKPVTTTTLVEAVASLAAGGAPAGEPHSAESTQRA